MSWRELVVPSDPVRRKRIKRGQRVAFRLTRQERDPTVEDTLTNEDDEAAHAMTHEAKPFTPKQGQYLARIFLLVHRVPAILRCDTSESVDRRLSDHTLPDNRYTDNDR